MKNININAPVKCCKTISIHANSAKIWSLLTRIDHWATWQTDIMESKLHGALEPKATFAWKSGGLKMYSTLHTVEAHERFGWTGKAYGIFAIHNWTLSEANGQTKVVVEESLEGLLARLFKKSLAKNLAQGMQTWLDLLKAESERFS